MKNNIRQSGFSLIEILVVVGIMGILTAVGIASYNKMNDRSRVEQAAQMLATELRTIQKRADSGENTCDSNQKFLGYEISQPVDETKIDYYPICDLSGVETTGAIKSFSLANGMSAKISDFPFRILSLGRGVDKVVSITLFKGDIKYRVDITKAGGISVVK